MGLYFQALPQDFVNGDLEGTAASLDSVPPAWEKVIHSDPACQATFAGGDEPDILSSFGPLGQFGSWGYAQSGSTFSSGRCGNDFLSPGYAQEGIQQTVSGFTPGASYTLHFYQTVVRLSSALDTSGYFAVYMDSILLGMTSSSGTDKTFKSIVLDWELRSLGFVATAPSHTFKFLPMDDDSLHDAPFYMLNMGIDNISIESNPVLDVQAVDLSAIEIQGEILLRWEGSEGNERMEEEVQRSVNGQDFESLGPAKPRSTAEGEFLDQSPMSGKSFYRIAARGAAGAWTYSNVVEVDIQAPVLFELKGNALVASQEGNWRARIYDVGGREMWGAEFEKETHFSGLSKGVYVLRVEDLEKGSVSNVKVGIR